MLHMIDRQSGVFTPQMSDRINTKSTALWEKIQSIYSPAIYPKLKITVDEIGIGGIPIVSEQSNSSFSIQQLHIVNTRITFTTSLTLSNTTVCRLVYAPNCDLVFSFEDGAYVVIVQKGTTEVKVWSSGSIQQLRLYFTYVV